MKNQKYENTMYTFLGEQIKPYSEIVRSVSLLQVRCEFCNMLSAVKVTHFLELVTVTVTFPKKELVTGKSYT
jgi:hypothetical protein